MIYYLEKAPKSANVEILDAIVVYSFETLELDESLNVTVFFDSTIQRPQSGYMTGDLDLSEFTIGLRPSIPLGEMTRTVFHEMTHVKQLVEGRWTPDTTTAEDYYKDPCEIEAFEKEEELTLGFVQAHDFLSKTDRKKILKKP